MQRLSLSSGATSWAKRRTRGVLLASRLFAADTYPDRRAPGYWTTFSYPFWFTDLLSALDSLSRLGFSSADGRIQQALGACPAPSRIQL